jgi:hypothetical protein
MDEVWVVRFPTKGNAGDGVVLSDEWKKMRQIEGSAKTVGHGTSSQ